MANPGPQDALRAARLLGNLVRLDALDETWTAGLRPHARRAEADTQALRDVAAEMRALVDATRDDLGWLSEFVASNAELVDALWSVALDLAPRPPETVMALRQAVSGVGGFAQFSRSQIADLQARDAELHAALAHEEERLEQGGEAHGDLPKWAKCALLAAKAAASIAILCAVLGPIVLAGLETVSAAAIREAVQPAIASGAIGPQLFLDAFGLVATIGELRAVNCFSPSG
jgi:hypothetical protein